MMKFFVLAILLSSFSVSAFRTATTNRFLTHLDAVKSSSNDKIRVKLLADVKGTGRYRIRLRPPIPTTILC